METAYAKGTEMSVDEISIILGELRADMSSSRAQRAELFKLVAEVRAEVGQVRTDMARHESKLDGHIDRFAEHDKEELERFGSMVKRIDNDVMPVVTEFKAVKNKALGIIAILSLMGTGAWQAIAKLGEAVGAK